MCGSLGKTNALNDEDMAAFIRLQSEFADSKQSWSVLVSSIDVRTVDLSAKNPRASERPATKSSNALLAEVMALTKQAETLSIQLRTNTAAPAWPTETVGSSCKITSGGTPSKAVPSYWTGSIPWVSAKDLKTDRIYDSELHISQEAVESSATKIAPVGSLLILVRGMGLANGIPIGEVMSPVAFNQDIRAIHPPAEVLPRYLLLSLRARLSNFREPSVLSCAAHGTLKIDADKLAQIEYSVPSLSEQRRTIEALDSALASIAEAKRATLRKALALDDLAIAVLSDTFASVSGAVEIRA